MDQLAWIALPAKDRGGARVKIRSQASGAERDGQVLRLRGDLEEQGRLARLIVALPNPLEAKPAPIAVRGYPFANMYLTHGTEENGLFVAVKAR